MNEKLADLVRRIVSGSVLLTGANAALPAVALGADAIPLNGPEATAASNDELVVRESRPRLILKRAAGTIMELVSSHRSHRSHSSHRSHYSSSSAPSRPPSRPSPSPVAPTPVTPLMSTPTLGSRILVLGMRGGDVMELMRLLSTHQYLRREEISPDSVFTKKVESAVKMFQTAQGLEADGKVGPTTVLLLKRPP